MDNFGSDLAAVEIPLGEIPPNPEKQQKVLGPAAVDGEGLCLPFHCHCQGQECPQRAPSCSVQILPGL